MPIACRILKMLFGVNEMKRPEAASLLEKRGEPWERELVQARRASSQ